MTGAYNWALQQLGMVTGAGHDWKGSIKLYAISVGK